MTSGRLEGAVCIVTGGLSGLGAATTRALLAEGAQVAVLARNVTRSRAEAEWDRAEPLLVEVDVRHHEQVENGFDKVVGELGVPNAVVHCAGIATLGRINDHKAERAHTQLRDSIDTNIVGTFNVARQAAIAMPDDSTDGRARTIVLTSSIAAFDGQAGQVTYAATKGAIASMTLPLARELAGLGIRVVTIAPGVFGTPMLDGLPVAARDALAAATPFPSRVGEPDEFASLVVHALDNAMLNGETIRLDGALRIPAGP
ncbi:MAG: SDR family NAD(P)-dependent oxidoreductase [Actinomycetota bacterium]